MTPETYPARISVTALTAKLADEARELNARQQARQKPGDDYVVTLDTERGHQSVSLAPFGFLTYIVATAGGPDNINWGVMPQLVQF